MNRRRAEAALVLNTVVWGATFVVVKAALLDDHTADKNSGLEA